MGSMTAYDGEAFRDEGWYARDLVGAGFTDCTFVDVDLTESSSTGAVFTSCVFRNCRFNASTHRGSAFVGCEFSRTSFFDATLDGCKLDGSVFADCTPRPLRVSGVQWRGVTMRAARGIASPERPAG